MACAAEPALPASRHCLRARARQRHVIRGHRWLRVCVLLGTLLAAACGEDAPRLPPLAEGDTVLAFGDSLTRGTGAPRGQGYPEILGTLIDRPVVNAGVPGELSAAGRARLARVLDEVRPALLLLCHGGNDLLRRRDGAHTARELTAMIEMARARGVAVLLLGVPAPGLLLSTAEFYHDVAAATATPLQADAIADVLGTAALKSDPVHPNAAGYRVIAEQVRNALEEFGAL